jgi:hypothetical protein
MVVNDKLERVWKEAVVFYFNVLSQYLCGEAEENLRLDSWSLGQDSEPRPSRYKGVLNIVILTLIMCTFICGLIVQEKMELPWIRLALDFAVLDIFCPDLLQYIFEEEFLQQFLSRGNACYMLLNHFLHM